MTNTFLKAEWKKLIMVNYAVESAVVKKYLPYKTELDLWNSSCFISLEGFMFVNTEVKGLKIPFHRNFEQVNLRFYVRFLQGNQWKRGVVFIKEITSKPLVRLVARIAYQEHYETMPLTHRVVSQDDCWQVEYHWKKDSWNSVRISTQSECVSPALDSEHEFITARYWGYTKSTETETFEYEVEHTPWKIYETKDHSVQVDFGNVYGLNFSFLNQQAPSSVFLAEGSEIMIKNRTLL